MNILVTLATYMRPKTAYFLKERLENENIDCFSAYCSKIDTHEEQIQVQVKEADVERAIKVMLRIKDEYGTDIENIDPASRARKILVPVDFSPGSENACHYAVRLAQVLGAEIKILHVYENPIGEVNIKKTATYEEYAKHMLREMENKAKSDIVGFTQKIRGYLNSNNIKDVRVHSTLVMGDIVGRIREVCNIYQPEVIVLGTIGKREESDSILAGLTNEIITGLEIPVYAIPGPYTFKAFKEVNILYATDFNEKDNTSLNQLLNIVEAFDKRITCIHIDTEHNPSKRERMDELNNLLRKEYSQYKISCRLIEDGDVYHGLKVFADENNINLLSFTTQKRGIFEKLFKPNLFKKVLQEANLPILIFPS